MNPAILEDLPGFDTYSMESYVSFTVKVPVGK